MDLITYHQHWHRLLLKRDPESIKALYPTMLPSEVDEAGLYHRYVQGHYTDAVTDMCCKFFQCLKFPGWTNLTEESILEEYYRVFPPTAYELRAMTFDFPNFLEEYVARKELPLYLSELAQLELMQFKVFVHEENEAALLEKLPAGSVALGPTLHFLQTEYNTVELLELLEDPLEEGFVPDPPEALQQIVLLSRDLVTRYCRITSPSTFALTVMNMLIDKDFVEAGELLELGMLPQDEALNELEFLSERGVILWKKS